MAVSSTLPDGSTAATLQPEHKRRDGEGKWLLKKAMEKDLPNDVLYRRKRGFAVPLQMWFKGPLKERVAQVMHSPLLHDAGVFEPAALHAMWSQHLLGREDYSPQIWAVLMFESFLRQEQAA